MAPTADEGYGSGPWDPFWEYVFGDDGKGTSSTASTTAAANKRKTQQKSDEGFLEYLFPTGDQSSSKSKSNEKDTGVFGRSFEDDRNPNSSSRSIGFSRSRSNPDEDSILAFLDQPYEISEKEYKRQEKRKQQRQQAQQKQSQKQSSRRGSLSRKNSGKSKGDDESWISTLSSFSGSFDEPESKMSRIFLPAKKKKKKRFGLARWRSSQGARRSKQMSDESWMFSQRRAEEQAKRSGKDQRDEDDFDIFTVDNLKETLTDPFGSGEVDDEEDTESEYTDEDEEDEEDEEDDGETSSNTSSYTEDASVYTHEFTTATEDEVTMGRSTSERSAAHQSEVRLRYSPKNKLLPPIDEDDQSEVDTVGTPFVRQKNRSKSAKSRGTSREVTPTTATASVSTQQTQKFVPPKAVVVDPDEPNPGRCVMPINNLGRVVCCSVKNLNPESARLAEESGLPIHELSKEDLEALFPKVRTISEQMPLSRNRSHIIGNSRTFEEDLPSHLQNIVQENGPQSLYQYEYETGVHKVIVYERFGPDPRETLHIRVSNRPPQLYQEGLFDPDKVIIQVEVSSKE